MIIACKAGQTEIARPRGAAMFLSDNVIDLERKIEILL